MLKISSNRRGLSAIIATVLLIALTLAIVGIVWTVVNNLVQEKIKTTESCGVLQEVELNPLYTCYNQTSGANELWFSIDVGEVEKLEDILVSISGQGTSSSFKIKADNPASLSYYNRTKPANIGIPGQRGGQGYIYLLPPVFTQTPDLIEIAPIIKGEQCAASSSIDQFDSCASLA